MDDIVFGNASQKSVKAQYRNQVWQVYTHYEVRDRDGRRGEPVGKYIVVPPQPIDLFSRESGKGKYDKGELLSVYCPLIETPDLFLEFARLADNGGLDVWLHTEKNEDVALGWAETYGVLGLTPASGFGEPRIDEVPMIAVDYGLFGGILGVEEADDLYVDGVSVNDMVLVNPFGGEGDTVARFAYEAWVANTVLRVYEAATDPRGADVKKIQDIWKHCMHPERTRAPEGEAAVEWALRWVKKRMQLKLMGNTFPRVYGTKNPIQGWAFSSLLGAMWLQMMWLYMVGRDTSGARRCKYRDCSRIITFLKPEELNESAGADSRPGGRRKYKTRKDKEFCSDNCKSKHNYHKKRGRCGPS